MSETFFKGGEISNYRDFEIEVAFIPPDYRRRGAFGITLFPLDDGKPSPLKWIALAIGKGAVSGATLRDSRGHTKEEALARCHARIDKFYLRAENPKTKIDKFWARELRSEP